MKLRTLVVTLALCAIPAATAGCSAAAIVGAVPLVSAIVTDGLAVLSAIESAVASYFVAHPSPAQGAIMAALTRAHLALITGEQALAGVTAVTSGQEAAAFADFAAAYGDLMALVAPIGIVPATGGAADGGLHAAPAAVAIPTPLAVRAQGK